MFQPRPYLLRAEEFSDSKPNEEILARAEMSSGRHKPCRWDLGTSSPPQQHWELQQGESSQLLPAQWESHSVVGVMVQSPSCRVLREGCCGVNIALSQEKIK